MVAEPDRWLAELIRRRRAKSLDETVQLMRGAIQFHLDGMREDGLPIPEPSSVSTVIEVEAA